MSTTAQSAAARELVDEFSDFFDTYCKEQIGELAAMYPSDRRSLYISLRDLAKYDASIADDYLEAPDTVREYAEQALAEYPLPVDVDLSGAEVRAYDLPAYRVRDVYELRSEDINELVGIRGVIHKQTQIKPALDEAAFECQRCGAMQYIPQSDGFQEPHECNGCERQGPFQINWDESSYHDSRLIRVQTPPDRRQQEEDAQIDVWLEHDLCSQVAPGDRVILPAILRIDDSDPDDGKQFDISADARSVRTLETDFEDISISDDERDRIHDIATSGDPFTTLVNSFAPDIYGYESIKEAIILQLFGGVTKPLEGGGKERGHSHVALVGDPSTGKSSMLKYASKIAPRSVFTSGKGSSAAGLTASAVRDDFGPGDEWSLEGGAIVKADKGLACVDELDDMDSDDRSSMHEALADMTVSISKAGINATLNARTTLLAAMNPAEGRFSEKVGVAEQIDLDPALLSRFDLIFTFTDEIEEEQDRKIAMHKINSWQAAGKKQNSDVGEVDVDDSVAPDLAPELLRKYIAYAKQNYTPVLTDEAGQRAADELVELRQANGGGDDEPIPVTVRKLGALVRLAEASARARLSEDVEVSDVDRAARLAKQSLKDVGMDPETGELDADIIETGVSNSQQQRRNQMEAILREEAKEYDGAGMPLEKYIKILVEDAGHAEDKVRHDIKNHFKRKGMMWKPDDDHIAWYD